MSKRGLRKISVTVTSQSYYHLCQLANMSGYKTVGRVIDKLVRDHMTAMRWTNDVFSRKEAAQK